VPFERPLISIVLLCYNQQDYVAEAIDGVLSQTYSPLEILIFDDCSSDNTAAVIESRLSARQTQHKVRFLRNSKNLNPAGTLKVGFDMAQGDLFVISCGDDIMFPAMVKRMADVWMTESVSLVTTNALYIDQHSNSLNRMFRDPNMTADDSFETLARDGSNACCFGPAIGFEPEVYKTFGWVPPYIDGYDIMIPFYAYLLKGAKFVNEPLLKYRVHNTNTSLSLTEERSSGADRLRIHERIYLNHLAHATLMEDELIRLANSQPDRYALMAQHIMPLLTIQLSEMAKKLARARRAAALLAGAAHS
jgi:glycosyltransferase involved in cell wall biosynthesis